jgi:hypothetical protein
LKLRENFNLRLGSGIHCGNTWPLGCKLYYGGMPPLFFTVIPTEMIQGSMVAIVTPMHEDGSLDLTAFRALIDFHIEQRYERYRGPILFSAFNIFSYKNSPPAPRSGMES